MAHISSAPLGCWASFSVSCARGAGGVAQRGELGERCAERKKKERGGTDLREARGVGEHDSGFDRAALALEVELQALPRVIVGLEQLLMQHAWEEGSEELR